MNRRSFLKSSASSIGAVIALSTVPMALTGCDTSWIQTAINDLPTIETILSSLTAIALDATGNGILDSIAQGVIDAAIAAANVGLDATQTAIAAYKANPNASTLADIDAALTAELPKLSAILSAAHIKDAALVNTITGAVNIAITVISSIQLLLPTSKASAKLSGAPKPTLMKPNQIIDQYNVVVTTNGYGKHHIRKSL